MSVFIQSALIYFGYLAVPVTALILLFKIRKPLWLALPVSLITDIIVLRRILFYYEFRGLAIFMIVYQLIILSVIITAIKLIAKLRKKHLGKLSDEKIASYKSKEKKIIVAVCAVTGMAIAGIAAHSVLLSLSDGYNRIFDKPVFSELIEIDVNDIETIELYYSREKLEEENFDIYYHGDKSFINSLTFDGSRLNNPSRVDIYEICSVRLYTKNRQNILFMHAGGDRFLAHYKNRQFYVKSAQLWEEIKR